MTNPAAADAEIPSRETPPFVPCQNSIRIRLDEKNEDDKIQNHPIAKRFNFTMFKAGNQEILALEDTA